MDIIQLISQRNLDSVVGNFINKVDPTQVKTTLLYFYSTVAQSMAALFTVSGFFAVYRLQSIDAKLSRSYASYREWINIRLINLNVSQLHRNQLQQRLAEQGAEILRLGVDIEPHSWLEKDMLAHARSYRNEARRTGSGLTRALNDYYRHFRTQNFFRLITKILSIFPLFIIGYLLLDSLTQISCLHLEKDFNRVVYIEDVLSILTWSKWLFIYLFIYIFITTFGPPEINDNNPITNRLRRRNRRTH